MSNEKIYPGLVIRSHKVRDAGSKLKAQDTMSGWQTFEMTAAEWLSELEQGHTIQPSLFTPKEDGLFTHKGEYWHGTHFICADADYLRGVDWKDKIQLDPDGKQLKDDQGNPIPVLDDNGVPVKEDVSPDGVEPWQADKQLCVLYPALKDDCYAALQSVSSMTHDRPPPHRRYRLIFVFDEMIKTEQHYHQILITLSERYPIIPAIDRAPSQPVFGNAKETGKAIVTGKVLSLSDFAYVKPVVEDKPSGNGKASNGKSNATQRKYQNDLDGLIADAKLTRHETDSSGNVRVDCPFNPSHIRDAFVSLDADGYPRFSCNHNSCSGNKFNEMVKQAGIKEVSKSKSSKAGDSVGTGEKVEPVEIAEGFMEKEHYWFTHEELHQYNIHTGLYQPCVPILRRDSRSLMANKARTQNVNEVQNHITDMAHRSEEADSGAVFKNGQLSFDTMNMADHSPDRHYLTGYPVNYNPSADVDERPFVKYLNELVMDMDAVVTLLEMIGSCFDDDVHDLQTAFMLTGNGSNGKSTLLEIIEALVGVENICRTPFPEYGKHPFAKGNLVGKSVALDDDIDLHIPLSSAIKPLITQKYQQCEQKYKQPFDFKMTATFIGAINGQPHTLDTTNAFWRRWCILDFPNVFTKDAGKKRKLMDTFTAPDMLDDIASMSLRAYAKARRCGAFHVPAHSTLLVESFKENTNHVITYATECLTPNPEGYVLRSAVWTDYQEWTKKNGLKAYSPKRFWGAIENEGYGIRQQKMVNDKNQRIVDDVALV